MVHRAPVAAGLALALAGACAGEIDNEDELLAVLDGSVGDGGGVPGEVACPSLGITDAYEELVRPTCATAACHGEAMLGGLSLEGDLGMLVDQPANTAGCAPLLLIDSSTIAESLMIQILEDAPPCSQSMPFPNGGLPADEKSCIASWVASLAQPQ